MPHFIRGAKGPSRPPRLITTGVNEWYVRKCLQDPEFDEYWWEGTRLVRELLNIQGLIAIDPTMVRQSIHETGAIIGRCLDPDQANSGWDLLKSSYGTDRLAPFAAPGGGPLFYEDSIFNQGEEGSYAPLWTRDALRMMNPNHGKGQEDFILKIHMPCLGAYNHGRMPLLRLIWENMMAKKSVQRCIPELKPHAVDLVIQVDYRDTRKQDLLLFSEQQMAYILEEEMEIVSS